MYSSKLMYSRKSEEIRRNTDIGNSLKHKVRLDLTTYKSKEIESTFIEIFKFIAKNKT